MFQTHQINLTQIGKLVRENPDLVKTVTFSDGSKAQFLNITISTMRNPDKAGNTETISCRPKGAEPDNKYYVGKGRIWNENNNHSSSQPAPQASAADDNLPF